MNICQSCGLSGGCGCLWKSPTLCKKCDAAAKGQELPLDLKMELQAYEKPPTLLGATKLGSLLALAQSVGHLQGAIAEVGVYKGGSLAALAEAFPARELIGFDTFAGMPFQGEGDVHQVGDFGDTSFEAVQKALRPYPNVGLVQGFFPDSARPFESRTFAFVHLDGDQYQTTRAGLEFFYPRLAIGGIIALDDYEWVNCPGVKRAVEEFCAANPGAKFHKTTEGQGAITKTEYDADTVEMHIDATGLGDSICALYAAAGLAKTGRKVVFATRHHEWFESVKVPGVEFVSHRQTALEASNDKRYGEQLAGKIHRKQFYCDAIARHLKIEKFSPSSKFEVLPAREKPIEGRYVVLSPFSAWDSRIWPVLHWKRLCELLSAAGLQPVVLDGTGDGQRLKEHFSGVPCVYFWGMSPQWVSDVLQNAQCVVGNDSGIAHLGGLLGAATVAVHSHLTPEHVFACTDVVSVTPDSPCAFCAWQRARGYGASCDSGCSALMGISAGRVFEAVMKAIGGEH